VQPRDDLFRVVEPPHMGIAAPERAVGARRSDATDDEGRVAPSDEFQRFEVVNLTIWLPAQSDAIEFHCSAPR
jgi:hypothetical protein